VSYKLSSYL